MDFFTLFTVLIFIGSPILNIILYRKYKKTKKTLLEADKKNTHLKSTASGYEKKIKQLKILEKYKKIVDIEAHCSHIEGEAEGYKKSAKLTLQKARDKAQEIAGEAIQLRDKEQLFKNSISAMRNTLQGYGSDYIIPPQDLLDDLAEDWGHKEAGEQLKQARNNTRQLIKNQAAALCDYTEASRKENAELFVLYAYNGKVDSTLSKIRHDNYGTLQQTIHDARSLIEYKGSSFRNARVTDEYHDSRLAELRWATATLELKKQEQEEQRNIKAQMREEEKARREYEKAIAQAEKEEKQLSAMMDKMRQEMEQTNAEEQQKLQTQIAELEQKYAEAEERNQRALSMAQMTKQGHVYVISNIGSFGENVFKIGMTRRLEPLDRVKELGDASVPFSFDIHAMIHSNNAPELEAQLHARFDDRRLNKINTRKEFFEATLLEIKRIIDELGIGNDIHWTMFAEAQEYKESKAIKESQNNIQIA